jgi:hypothetical protein
MSAIVAAEATTPAKIAIHQRAIAGEGTIG